MPLRCVNVGCGASPTPGWRNLDNSPSALLGSKPRLARLLRGLGLIDDGQVRFAEVAAQAGVQWADGSRRLPFETASVDVVYSSHMLEHLTRRAARRFLGEAHRCLKGGGFIRLAVPDLSRLVARYLAEGDADGFVERTLLADPSGETFAHRVKVAILGPRHHLWMYDGPSLARLLEAAGFHAARIVAAGATGIPDPGNLDLREREDESVYVEAVRGPEAHSPAAYA